MQGRTDYENMLPMAIGKKIEKFNFVYTCKVAKV